MTPTEAWYLTGVIIVFVLLLSFIGWGMLQTRGLEQKPIDHHF
ncbi:hypothetical protein GCM10011321_18830 [Youhaiella tibetensis]|nr:hypothetical protein [Youhaiella tibetensis]GGF27660.1 hypothetical protein GCM10011321_18830 [Youhaiella tibetensis]